MISHRVAASILVTYFDEALVNQTEERMRAILGKKGPKWKLSMWSDRPPMKERAAGLRLAKALEGVSEGFKLPIDRESSTWPSVAGLVPAKVGCMCGAGPVCREGGTPHEAVQRVSFVQRTLLMAEYLVTLIPGR